MRLLAFDTSGPALSAAAAEGAALVASRLETLTRGHAERLLPMLGEVLAEAGWRWRDVELVTVTLGPGNFTGLRAGIAVARALSLVSGCPTLGLGTLEAVAQAAAHRTTLAGRTLVVAMDARRGEAYAQRFAPDLAPLGPPALVTHEALRATLPGACVLAGDLGALFTDAAHEVVESAPDARYLAEVAWRRLSSGAVPVPGAVSLRPLYIRAPDARVSAGAPLVAAIR